MKVAKGESLASSQDNVYYCQKNGDQEGVVFVALVGAEGKKLCLLNKGNAFYCPYSLRLNCPCLLMMVH